MRLAALVSILVLAAACGGSETSSPTGAPRAEAGISGRTLGGEQLSLGDFRGQPVLINVWSSW